MRIYSVKHGSLNENDRLDLARLLVKAGYTVRLGREKPKKGSTWVYFVEYEEQEGGTDEQEQDRLD